MLLDQLGTNDDWATVACRWLQANEATWSAWLPDSTTCFAQFGMYNTVSGEFVSDRVDPTGLECRACPSGKFSEELVDNQGLTYKCTPCPAGSAQPSGAASQCEPCAHGEYQDLPGQVACKRCPISMYQDDKGQASCKACSSGTTTLGLGGVSPLDCGCTEGSIDTSGEGEAIACVSCGEGLVCPVRLSIGHRVAKVPLRRDHGELADWQLLHWRRLHPGRRGGLLQHKGRASESRLVVQEGPVPLEISRVSCCSISFYVIMFFSFPCHAT